MESADVSFLPLSVRSCARLVTDGAEVMWRRADVVDAIDALADAGKVVLGLDLRQVEADGRFTELAWSAFEPTGCGDCSAGRLAALDALERVDGKLRRHRWAAVRRELLWRRRVTGCALSGMTTGTGMPGCLPVDLGMHVGVVR